jgi:hypothetical protein
MADINLKTLTPDTSLPKTGFLFGADSQATTDPSVYTTQAVATTLLGSTSLTGDVLTADAPVLNLTQTWNSVGTTFTGLKFNVDTTTYNQSASNSLLMDLQVGGVSKFNVTKSGLTYLTSSGFEVSTTGTAGAATRRLVASNGLYNISTNYLYWSSSPTDVVPIDLQVGRRGPANFGLGAADAASATPQSLSVQSVVAGTTDGAGAAFTINGSQGTGSGAGGSIIFQTAPANTGGGATIQNVLAPALTIVSDKSVRSGNAIFQDNYLSVFVNVSDAQSLNFTQRSIILSTGISNPAITLNANGLIGFTSATSGDVGVVMDTILRRDAAGTLAQRNGVIAQTSRLYLSYTDGSNYTRLALKTASGVHTLETESAGSGDADIDLALTPKGTGRVRYGTHAAVVAEVVTGYIEIKDAGGTVRKLAVIS